MIWLAVDKNGDELIFEREPVRCSTAWDISGVEETYMCLPKGSIEKLLGRPLTWEDEAVCVE